MSRQCTPEGLALTRARETLVLFAYDDAHFPPRPAAPGDVIFGTLTWGYGHAGPDVYPGRTGTAEEAETVFKQDHSRAEAVVDRDCADINLTPHQFDALADFVFSVGVGHFEASTLLKDLVAGNLDDVPTQLRRWDCAGGRKSPGLDARRDAEIDMWNMP